MEQIAKRFKNLIFYKIFFNVCLKNHFYLFFKPNINCNAKFKFLKVSTEICKKKTDNIDTKKNSYFFP